MPIRSSVWLEIAFGPEISKRTTALLPEFISMGQSSAACCKQQFISTCWQQGFDMFIMDNKGAAIISTMKMIKNEDMYFFTMCLFY